MTLKFKMYRITFACLIAVSLVLVPRRSSNALPEPDSSPNGVNTTRFSINHSERTLILLKPDAVQRGLIGKIIERFEHKGFKLVAMKLVWATKDVMEKHYQDHVDSYYFNGLVEWMISSPIIAMVWEGWSAVKLSRRMLGPPDTLESTPGTIRGDFSTHFALSVIHGAHTIEAAEREIPLWFSENELIYWTPDINTWVQP